ncbi:hypothetical protein BGX26_012728 [Mortierella sp. AD094]|nr:hypothetical protein BGX26_012728 [Mortierella sp. AD094]
MSTSSGDTSGFSFRVTEYAAPLSPPQSSPIRPPVASAHYHYHQNVDRRGEGQNFNDFANDDGFRTPSMYSPSEGEIYSAKGPVPDRMEENIDHDTFIERLEDLDMTDMTISPINTPLPTGNTSPPSFRHIQVPLSPVTPTRRRRLIVEEESDQSIADETTRDLLNNPSAFTYLNAKQTPQRGVAQQAGHSPRENDQDNSLEANKKSRVLKDITMSVPVRKSEEPLSQKEQDVLVNWSTPKTQIQQQELQQSQEQLQRPQEQLQQQGLQYRLRGQQGQPNTQQSIPERSSSPISSTNATQDLGIRRSLQPRGPWRWQVQRTTEIMSQTSSIGSITDISSSVSSVVSPLAGAAPSMPSQTSVTVVESVVMAPRVNLANLFAMNQPTQFYVAESSAYLPLLVHVPRYLRPRRKRSRQGRSLIKRMTPIILSTNCGDQAKLSNGETPTPDITSPENSYLSHSVSTSADSQVAGGDA